MVDPVDADEEHLLRVAAQGPVAVVLLTRRRYDHAGGARRFAELSGVARSGAGPDARARRRRWRMVAWAAAAPSSRTRTGPSGPYLDSLRLLAGLPSGTIVLPDHGPEPPDTPIRPASTPRTASSGWSRCVRHWLRSAGR